MHTRTRLGGLLLVTAAAACNTGLDPRRLELLHYDMPLAEVVATLGDEAEPEPLLRFFLTADDGRTTDWLLQHATSRHPHPDYRLLHADQRLASVWIATTWYDDVDLWQPAPLQQWTAQKRNERLPLRWAELEPLDAAVPTQRMSPTGLAVVTLTLGLPGLVLSPILYPLALLMEGDLDEQGAALFAAGLVVAPGATPGAVAAAAGKPGQSHTFTIAGVSWQVDEHRLRHCSVNGKGARFAFRDGHLAWVQFASFLPEFRLPPAADPASLTTSAP